MHTCAGHVFALLIVADNALVDMAVSSRVLSLSVLMTADIQLHRPGDIQLRQISFPFVDRN